MTNNQQKDDFPPFTVQSYFLDYVDTLAHHQDLNFVVRSLVLRIPSSVVSSQLHQSRFQASLILRFCKPVTRAMPPLMAVAERLSPRASGVLH